MDCLLQILLILLLVTFIGINKKVELAAASHSTHFNIGTLYGTGTQQWRNLKHAIDEWNAKNADSNNFNLHLVNPTDFASNLDIRFCDIVQRNLVALYVPFGESMPSYQPGQSAEFRAALSMCHRFRMPCLVDRMPAFIKGGNNPFALQIGPPSGLLGRALVQLMLRMMWSSFLLLYKHPNDLADLLPLFGLWRSSTGSRVSFRVLQLPTEADPARYGIFMKHIREQLRHTNIIIHTDDLGTVHSVLAHANQLNMTETRHSYLVANMDLRLLEDFLGQEYHCNITGFQFVRNYPLFKLDLGLAIEAVATIGSAISALRQRQLEPRPQQLLCDAGDQWTDGMLLQEQLKRVQLGEDGQRRTTMVGSQLMGITRMPNGTFTEIGEWNDASRRWTFDENYDEKNKWRFRMTKRGIPDLRGEKLRVVVYLEEPFVMRKIARKSSSTSAPATKFDTLQQRGWPTANRYEGEGGEYGAADDDQPYEGFCIDLLKEMAKLLNFTYEVVEVDDGAYGVEDENGRWNGIIGVLQRHEADLSVSAVTITYSRVSVVDFTLPFMHLGIAILMRRNMADEGERSAGSNLFTFMEPLSLSVWIALGIAYIGVASTMWLLAKCSPYEWYDDVQKIDERRKRWRRDGSRRYETPHPSTGTTADAAAVVSQITDQQRRTILDRFLRPRKKNQFSLLNSLWFAVGSLMQQGSDVIPRAAATRTVAVIWWLFTLILISSYTAQLAAFLTVERMSTPVESSADLAAQQRIKFGTLSNGSTMEFFRESKIPIYERMWSIMQSSSPTVFVNSSREGIARVRVGNYAYLMESTMLEYWIGEDCQLQTVGGYGVALPKGSPLMDIFSQAVLQLQERTILEALKNKWWTSQHRHRTESASNVGGRGPVGGCPPPGGHYSSHSSLHRVFGIFYVLFAGILVALLLAIGEFCIESRRRQSLRLGLCLPGRLINLYFVWQDGQKERQKLSAGQRLKGSQLYLDNVGPIGGGASPDGSEEDGRQKTDTGTGRTRLSDSTFGSDSSYTSSSNRSSGDGGSSAEGAEDGGGGAERRPSHSSQSLEEMDDSIASLRRPPNRPPHSSHHSNCPMGQKHAQQMPSHLPPATLPRYRTTMGGRPLRQQISMPEQSTSGGDSGDQPLAQFQRQGTTTGAPVEEEECIGRLAVPSRPRRKISEPAPPPPSTASHPRRKNSIRNVFSKMSTPSIMIGADPQDLLALQHLIPPTDERLLSRRQSSQEHIAQQQQAQDER